MAKKESKTTWPDNNPESGSNIERLFRMFAAGAMSPKPYRKVDLPKSVTAYLSPEDMEILHVISRRLGAKRGNIASHIMKLGLMEASRGCGFEVDENGLISDDQKAWDLTQHQTGFSFPTSDDE